MSRPLHVVFALRGTDATHSEPVAHCPRDASMNAGDVIARATRSCRIKGVDVGNWLRIVHHDVVLADYVDDTAARF